MRIKVSVSECTRRDGMNKFHENIILSLLLNSLHVSLMHTNTHTHPQTHIYSLTHSCPTDVSALSNNTTLPRTFTLWYLMSRTYSPSG